MREMRHKFMIKNPDLRKEMDNLMFKMNPGEIELYDAAFSDTGVIGELAFVIDMKVKEILRNRERMRSEEILDFAFQLTESEQKALHKNKNNFKRQMTLARKSRFV